MLFIIFILQHLIIVFELLGYASYFCKLISKMKTCY